MVLTCDLLVLTWDLLAVGFYLGPDGLDLRSMSLLLTNRFWF